MYTETYIEPIPKPEYTPAYTVETQMKWLKLIRESRTEVDIGLVSLQPVIRQPITQKRDRKNRYETNYLFFSPDAELIAQTPARIEYTAPGTLIWFPPGIPYSLYINGEPLRQKLHRFRFKVFVKGMNTTVYNDMELFPGCLWYPDFAESLAREKHIPDEYTGENIRQLMLRFSIRLFRMKQDKQKTDTPLSPAQMRELHTFMIRNISRRPAPSELAEVVGLSPAYFTKVFVKTTGVSPRRWILEQRIRYSTQLLQEATMNISEIAYWLGYEEPRLYTRQFSDVFGISPTAYRKK